MAKRQQGRSGNDLRQRILDEIQRKSKYSSISSAIRALANRLGANQRDVKDALKELGITNIACEEGGITLKVARSAA